MIIARLMRPINSSGRKIRTNMQASLHHLPIKVDKSRVKINILIMNLIYLLSTANDFVLATAILHANRI